MRQIVFKKAIPFDEFGDYVTTAQEDEYDLQCYNAAIEEWEKDGRKTYPVEDLYKEYGVR